MQRLLLTANLSLLPESFNNEIVENLSIYDSQDTFKYISEIQLQTDKN